MVFISSTERVDNEVIDQTSWNIKSLILNSNLIKV